LQELCNYLTHIVQVWNLILEGSETLPSLLMEEHSVNFLEGLVPALSSADGNKIRSAILDGSVFAAASPSDRTCILENLQRVSCMIPSLNIFFESLKYLKPCTDIIRSLLPVKSKRTIREELFQAFRQPAKLKIEYATGDYRDHPSESKLQDRMLCYQMLWLAVIRRFVELGNTTTRKEPHERKPVATEPSPVLKQELARQAHDLGFKASPIQRTKTGDGAMMTAHRVVQSMGEQNFENCDQVVKEIAEVLRRRSVKPHHCVPNLTQEAILPIGRRFGRPFTDDYMSNQKVLFLPNIYTEPPRHKSESVSPFFCVRDMIIYFLGIEKVRCIFLRVRI
jgi:hypothetical protein